MTLAIPAASDALAEISLDETSIDNFEDRFTEKDTLLASSTEIGLSSMFCVPALDRLHDDFLRGLLATAASDNQDFIARYGSFVSLAEHTFRQEEQWMEEVDLFILKTHQEQHARVLGALHNAHCHVMKGNLVLGRDIVERLLPQWFTFHRSTMDVTLALALQLAQAESEHAGHPEEKFDIHPSIH